MPAVIRRAAVIGGVDHHACDQLGVFEARANAPLDLLQQQVGGHYQGQAVDVAEVDDLEQLFLRPRGGVVRAKIVHHQQRR